MYYFSQIFNIWQVKVLFGAVVAFFAPFQAALVILILFIVIDTATGVIYSLKIKKFKSVKFRRGAFKLISYSAAVIVARFLEIGIAEILETTMISNLMLSLLIFTEAISIFENLALLNVPIPSGFIKLIINKVKSSNYLGFITDSVNKLEYTGEIDDLILYQIPNIKSGDIQKILKVKFEEWKNTINIIDKQFINNGTNGNELIYYRLSVIINETNDTIYEKCVEENIPVSCIKSFNLWQNAKTEKWMAEVKEICYTGETLEKKKKYIMEKILTGLYQTIVDIQKGEKVGCLS